MALDLQNKYPGRFDPKSADYPQGKFKNRSSPTAQDGSYMERDWLNDWGGFFGALLRNAGLTPNETVDTAQSSQFYDAMMAVSRAGSFKNATIVSSGSITLTAAQVGQSFLLSGTSQTVSLPALSSVPVGSSYNMRATNDATISTTGGVAMQVGNSLGTSLQMTGGSEVVVISYGSVWGVFGTGALEYSAAFAGLKAVNGWRRLPGGFIEQWGTTAAISDNSSAVVTLPIPFPTGCVNAIANHTTILNAGACSEAVVMAKTASTITIAFNSNSQTTSSTVHWRALGY